MSTKEVEWDGLPIPKRYWAILAIAMGITVSVLDGTIANVALPSIAQDLQATPAMSIWIVNAYQLAIVVSLLSLSSLGDILGYRRVYIGGLLIFSVTSLACALSNSLLTLTVARVFQGFGAAALASVNTSLIRIIYPKRHLGRGMGINAVGGCRVGGRRADDCGGNFVCSLLAVVVCDKCSHCNRGVDFIFSFFARESGKKKWTEV